MSNIKLASFGKERKRLAVWVIAIGITTFFLPMVVVDPPVLNRTEWSPLHIAAGVLTGKLPVPHGSLDPRLLGIALIYGLMIAFLAALLLRDSPKALPIISIIGCLVSSSASRWRVTFRWTFFPYFGQVHAILAGNAHVHEWHLRVGPAWWILPWIMPALLAICFAKDLDHYERE
jgi:hypothetical protein